MKNLTPFSETLFWALENTWPMLTLFVVILISVKVSMVIIGREKVCFYKDFYSLLSIIYFLLLYFMLLGTENAASYGVNLTPFKEITRYAIGSKSFYYNVLGNIALFIPFGYFISDMLKAKKISHIFFISILISLTAELIQFKIGRAFDVDDIILNFAGSIIGFMGYISVQAIKHHLPKILKNEIFYNILALLVLLILVVLFGSIWGIRI